MEKVYTATKGPYVNIPFNRPVHRFTNETDKTAHILCFTTPAGMEKIVRRNKKAGSRRYSFTYSTMMPEELKRLQSIAEKYGQKLYPRHYFDL